LASCVPYKYQKNQSIAYFDYHFLKTIMVNPDNIATQPMLILAFSHNMGMEFKKFMNLIV
jgi:hypothetical protein